MKKGQIYEGMVERLKFPNKGLISMAYPVTEEEDGVWLCREDEAGEPCDVMVKNTLPGQRVRFAVSKKRKGKAEGRLLEVTERSPLEMEEPACPHFGLCGGCNYQTLPYAEQLRLKSGQVLDLMRGGVPDADAVFEGIKGSPRQFGYRNKMEFTFGDAYKDGPLSLGMHKRGGFYDIVTVDHCQIVDEDYRKILSATAEYFQERQTPFYHRMRHEGYLRHLLVRKAVRTGEILVDLVTTTQVSYAGEMDEADETARGVNETAADAAAKATEVDLLEGWKQELLSLRLEGSVAGSLHTKND
ncbi:MAG: 23S rRNA (uracil-5-)-methyltransferase RumA, partial [Clostridiales bacterium]|nr:23S rRNA (uracil-5-)-methyltransferase RumA [Clostridiales bacterium]